MISYAKIETGVGVLSAEFFGGVGYFCVLLSSDNV
jgi:hypothetical protein